MTTRYMNVKQQDLWYNKPEPRTICFIYDTEDEALKKADLMQRAVYYTFTHIALPIEMPE